MPPRRFLGLGLVVALVVAVAVALAASGDGVDEPFADVPTDVEAATPTSVTSVPNDEGIDRDIVWIADLARRGVSGGLTLDPGRFEAVLETDRVVADEPQPGSWLCADMVIATPDDGGEVAAAVRIGAEGEAGEIVADLGVPQSTENGAGDVASTWDDRCVSIDEELVISLQVSTDAYHVVVFQGDQANEVARGQLQLATLFDRELDDGP